MTTSAAATTRSIKTSTKPTSTPSITTSSITASATILTATAKKHQQYLQQHQHQRQHGHQQQQQQGRRRLLKFSGNVLKLFPFKVFFSWILILPQKLRSDDNPETFSSKSFEIRRNPDFSSVPVAEAFHSPASKINFGYLEGLTPPSTRNLS